MLTATTLKQSVAKKIAKAVGAENYNILQNNGRLAHQVVDHVRRSLLLLFAHDAYLPEVAAILQSTTHWLERLRQVPQPQQAYKRCPTANRNTSMLGRGQKVHFHLVSSPHCLTLLFSSPVQCLLSYPQRYLPSKLTTESDPQTKQRRGPWYWLAHAIGG